MENVYEEYRQRLININAPIINLEIFETFIGTGFLTLNSLDLLEVLINNDMEEIIEKLEDMKENIFINHQGRYTDKEKAGYYLIIEGYLLRLKMIEKKKV